MSYPGVNAVKLIAQENDFPKTCQISNYFGIKYTIIVQIGPGLQKTEN